MTAEIGPDWLFGSQAQMNVTYTQANAAGGAVVCEISAGAGSEFIVLRGRFINSGTNGIQVVSESGVAGTVDCRILTVASAAGTIGSITTGSVSTAQTSDAGMGLGYPFIVSGGQAFRIQQSAAGAQNDTFQIILVIRVRGDRPTVTHANSTNPANVTATAGVEGFLDV